MYNNLRNTFLFKHLSLEGLEELLKISCHKTTRYKKGQFIYDNRSFIKEIGIVLEGRIEVQKNLITGKKVIVNQLKSGDVFGVATLFQDKDHYISSLFTKTEVEIFFISEEQLLKLFQLNQGILLNYLRYINDRIYFLNNRIECFTHEQVKDRILFYLEELIKSQKDQIISIPFCKSELAEYLGVSRASLYRCLKQIEEEKLYKIRAYKIINLNS